MPSAQAWEKGFGMAMVMPVLMSWGRRLFVVLTMCLVEMPAVQLRINHCKMEAVTTAAALTMESLWRAPQLAELVHCRFP